MLVHSLGSSIRSSVVLYFLLNDAAFVRIAAVTFKGSLLILLDASAPTCAALKWKKVKGSAQLQNAL